MTQNPIYAIGYARVSTPKQAIEGDSLDLQADKIRRLIASHGWSVFPHDRIFQEPFTGTTDSRPIYEETLRIIRANPHVVRYFVVNTIDRFSREGSFKYEQMKKELAALGVELVDCGGIIQPTVNSLAHLGFKYDWSERSPSKISELVIAEAADQERSRFLARTVEAQILLTRDGYHLGPANDGYIAKQIVVAGKKRFAQFPDPQRAQFFQTMFEMRAKGSHSDPEIVRHLNSIGFRTRSVNHWDDARTTIVSTTPGRPLTVKQFQRNIQNPVYCGVLVRKWTHGKAVRAQGGEPLVAIDLFNRANRSKLFIEELADGTVAIFYGRESERLIAKRHKFSTRWRYKNVLACPHCRKPLWASASRGKSGKHFAAYHCTRGHARYSVALSEADATISSYLERLRLEPSFLEAFRPLLVSAWADAEKSLVVVRTQRHEEVAKLKMRRDQLAMAFVDAKSPSIRRVLEDQVSALDLSIEEASTEAPAPRADETDLSAFLEYAKEVLEHPHEILENIENLQEQRALYDLIFAAPPTYEEIVSGTPHLRPTFRFFFEFSDPSFQTAARQSLDWNTLNEEVKRWQKAYWAIDTIRERMKLRGHGNSERQKAA